MRVAIFTDTYQPQINGVTNTLDRMSRYLEDQDIDFRIFAPHYEETVSERNVERFYSLKFFLYPECRITLPNVFRVHAALNEYKPDVIHLMTEFNMGLMGLNYALKNRIPVISNYSTNFSQYTDYYKIDLLRQGVSSYMNWFHNQCLLTTCPSRSAEAMLHTFGVPRTTIFSRGIDAGRFSPMHRNDILRRELGLENKVALLYVGRVAAEKDMGILRDSYETIHSKYPDQVRLVIVGDGPMLETCRNTFPADTLFLGFRKGHELAQIYASCDIFVSPSSTETFGNVVLEAMASGLAVVGAHAGGVGEIIRPLRTGLLFSARSSQSMVQMVEKLIVDASFRGQLQQHGREHALSRDWQKILDDLAALYKGVIQEERADTQLTMQG